MKRVDPSSPSGTWSSVRYGLDKKTVPGHSWSPVEVIWLLAKLSWTGCDVDDRGWRVNKSTLLFHDLMRWESCARRSPQIFSLTCDWQVVQVNWFWLDVNFQVINCWKSVTNSCAKIKWMLFRWIEKNAHHDMKGRGCSSRQCCHVCVADMSWSLLPAKSCRGSLEEAQKKRKLWLSCSCCSVSRRGKIRKETTRFATPNSFESEVIPFPFHPNSLNPHPQPSTSTSTWEPCQASSNLDQSSPTECDLNYSIKTKRNLTLTNPHWPTNTWLTNPHRTYLIPTFFFIKKTDLIWPYLTPPYPTLPYLSFPFLTLSFHLTIPYPTILYLSLQCTTLPHTVAPFYAPSFPALTLPYLTLSCNSENTLVSWGRKREVSGRQKEIRRIWMRRKQNCKRIRSILDKKLWRNVFRIEYKRTIWKSYLQTIMELRSRIMIEIAVRKHKSPRAELLFRDRKL